MKNSYQNDIQTVQLGNIISSVGSLLDRSESMQETLSMFHLEQSAEILLQLLEAGDEPVKTEILTASFLGDVAEVLYKRLAGLDFPEDTPKNVLAALANGLMVKSDWSVTNWTNWRLMQAGWTAICTRAGTNG